LTPAGANAWTAWTEIVDNNGVAFSSMMAVGTSVHITVIVVEVPSVNNQVFMFDFAYGTGRIPITSFRIYSGAVPKQDTRVYAKFIPSGQRLYYRGKCNLAGPQNCIVHFRYHYH